MEIVSYDLEDINPDNFDLDVFSSSIPIDSSDLVTTTTTTTTAATTTASSPSSCASSCFCGAMNRGLDTTTNANAIYVVDSPKNMACDDATSFDKAQQLQTTLFVLNSTSTATATTSSEDEMKRKKRSTPLKRKNGKKVEVEDKRDLSSVVDSGLVVIKKHLSTDKPPEPYADIIAKAILSSDVNSMQLKDIYTYMSENYKEFVSRVAQKKWRNAIRHNLSSHRYFAKTTERNAQGYYWSIRPLYERELRTSLLSGSGSTNNKNKNRRLQEEKHNDDDDDDEENEENNDCDDENEDEDEERTKSSKTKANKKSKTVSVKVAAKKGNKPKRLTTTPGKSRRARSTRNKVESSNLANMVTSNNPALVSHDLLRVRDDLNYSPTPYITMLNSDALLNSSIGPGSNLSSTTYNSSTSSTPAPSRSSSSSLSSSSYATMFNTSNNTSLNSMNQSQNDSAYFDGSSYYYYYYSPRLDMPPHQSSSSSSTSSTSSPSQQNWSTNPSAQQTTTYRFLDSTNYSYMNGYGFDYSTSNYS